MKILLSLLPNIGLSLMFFRCHNRSCILVALQVFEGFEFTLILHFRQHLSLDQDFKNSSLFEHTPSSFLFFISIFVQVGL